MRRLILQTGVSIDGYVAALDRSHPWGEEREDEAFKRWVLDSVWAAGAHLMGRVTGAPLHLELVEATTHATVTVHVYRPRRAPAGDSVSGPDRAA